MTSEIVHRVKASSFADPRDVVAYRKWYKIYRDEGMTDEAAQKRAFRKGDNGIGVWGDDTSEGSGLACALPYEDIEERWGTILAGKHKLVEVAANGSRIVCVLKDRMPHRANIENGAGIDLNPDAVRALGEQPPIMISATWQWM